MPRTKTKQSEQERFAALAAELGEQRPELIAVAVSAAAGCRPCTEFHVKAARAAGATPGQIRRAAEDAERVTRDAASAMTELVVEASGAPDAAADYGDPVLAELVPAGAAFAASWAAQVKERIEAAQRHGTTDRQVEATLRIARMIKGVAADRAEAAVADFPGGRPDPEGVDGGGCCGPNGGASPCGC
jgi:AhpD family alkylhydroperoxidase